MITYKKKKKGNGVRLTTPVSKLNGGKEMIPSINMKG